MLALGLPALAGLGGYLIATRDELSAGQDALYRRRLDRALNRGFTGLLPGFGGAEEAFSEALALDPANLEATAGLALHHLALHQRIGSPRPDEARRVLDRQESLTGRHPDLLRVRLLCAEAEDDADEAAALRREIGDHRSALGYIIESTPYWPLADAGPRNSAAVAKMHHLASLACDLSAGEPRLYHWVLRGLSTSDADETVHVADVILQNWKDDPDAVLSAAGVMLGDDARARRMVEEQVLPLEPDRPAAWMILGVRWGSEDAAEAERCFLRALAGEPNRWITRRVGYLRLELGRPQDALQAFQDALGMGQVVPEDLTARGQARRELGDLAGAEEDFRRAIGLWEDYYGGEYFLAPLLEETGRVEEALQLYRRCVELDGQSRQCRLRLGNALGRAGRAAEARTVWEDASLQLPDDPWIWNGWAWCLIDPRHAPGEWSPEEAVSYARLADKHSGGENPWILNTLGVALYRSGDDARALETLERAARLQAANGEPAAIVEDQAFIAAAAARLGRLEQAVQALDSARCLLALDPDSATARAVLAEAEAAVAAAQVAGQTP